MNINTSSKLSSSGFSSKIFILCASSRADFDSSDWSAFGDDNIATTLSKRPGDELFS